MIFFAVGGEEVRVMDEDEADLKISGDLRGGSRGDWGMKMSGGGLVEGDDDVYIPKGGQSRPVGSLVKVPRVVR